MTPGAQMRTLVAKETRALLPIWMACVLAASLAPFMHGGMHDVSVLAFVEGMIVLGAYSIGHEYVHRTVGVMLMLPVERRRVFLVKLGVLAAMVLPLAGYASLLGLFAEEVPPWLIALGALCLAPSLTMLCRNPLAGATFSLSLSATLLAAVMMIRVGRWDAPADATRAAFVMWSQVMVVVCAGGAVLAWRRFKRLESIDSGVEISLPWRAATMRDVAPTHPLWQLVRKELRLQRLAFALAALYVVVAAAEAALGLVRPHHLPFLAAATMGYGLCLPVLIGSIASAEERQLGTLSWQLLLPAPAWQQWAAKAGTVFGLALALGVAVPALVLQLPGLDDRLARGLPPLPAAMILVFVLSAASLYISSLSSSGVRAVAMSFAAITAFLWLANIFAWAIGRPVFQGPFGIADEPGGTLAMLAVAAVLLVRFAFVNHRSEEPGTARVWRPMLWLTGFVAFAIVLIEWRPF